MREVVQFPVADLRYRSGYEKRYANLELELATKAGRENLRSGGSTREFLRLFESLRDRGMLNPLICHVRDNPQHPTVLIGNQRLCCARVLGWDEVAVVFVGRPDLANQEMNRYEQIGYDIATDRWEMVP